MSKDLEYIYIDLDDTTVNTTGTAARHTRKAAPEDDDIFMDTDIDTVEASSEHIDEKYSGDAGGEYSGEPEKEYDEEAADDESDGKDTARKKSRRKKIIREIISYVLIVAAAFVLATLTNRYLIVNARIPSGSMIPTITEGNRIIGNRLAYMSSDPKRGDVVVFYYPDDETQKYIKRIIGLPGETVYIEHGTVYIDGQPLDESDYLTVETAGVSGPFTVPEGCYFMMGDNRNSSWDSRFWNNTFVSRDKIIAKAMFCYFPTIHLIK